MNPFKWNRILFFILFVCCFESFILGTVINRRQKFKQITKRPEIQRTPRSKSICRLPAQNTTTYHPLPDTVTPIRYKLRFRVDTKRNKLYGHSLILVYIHNRTSTIELNAVDLAIMGGSFHTRNIRVDARMIYNCPKTESVILQFPKPLHRGSANLTITFTGNLTKMIQSGLVKLKNNDKVVVTDFGPLDARRMFACWDEPRFKAIFDIYLIIPKHYQAISNQPSNRRRDYSTEYDEIRFESTPRMSPHQLTTIIAPRVTSVANDNSTSNVKISLQLVNGNSQSKQKWKYALDTGEMFINYFNYYLQTKLPIRKLDLVVMNQYKRISLEKFGLVLFDDQQLAIENHTLATEEELNQVAETMAHSIAHQWLGSLVTFEQWNQFWLFEALATFMEKEALNSLFPQWRSWERFTADEMRIALQIDSSSYSKPLQDQIESPNDITQVLSKQNVYRKSTFLLNMLRSTIGNEHFQKGIQIFIKAFSNTTATVDDLWNSFHKAIDAQKFEDSEERKFLNDVVDVVSKWTTITGFPVLHVEESQVGETRVLKVRQEQFVELNADNRQSKQVWPIPISIIDSFNPFSPAHQTLITDEMVELTLNNVWEGDWVKLNSRFSNFYRVHYTEEMLDKFFISIEEKLLPSLDRLNLIDDLFALIRAGYVQTNVGLNFIWSYENEDNPNVWSVIVSSLKDIDQVVSSIELNHLDGNHTGTIKRNYRDFARELLKKMYQKLGWYADTSLPPVGQKMMMENFAERNLRESILCTMGLFEGEDFIKEAFEKYEDYLHGQSDLPIGLLRCVFRAYSSFHSIQSNHTFDKLFQIYNEYNLPEARHLFSYALGSTDNIDEMHKVVEFALKPYVHSTNAHIMLRELCQRSQHHRQYIIEVLNKRFAEFVSKFSTFDLMYDFLKDLIESFSIHKHLQTLEQKLSRDPKLRPLHQSLLLSFEKVKITEQWLKRDQMVIVKYFEKSNEPTEAFTEVSDNRFSEVADNRFFSFEEFDKKRKKKRR